jgi:predicted nucleic acid-binding Zn ribbon protein
MADRKPGRRSPAPLSTLLSDSFRGRPLEKRFGEVEIWRIWGQVVGHQIAAKAQPSRFSNGVLTVVVISAPWMQQLNFMKMDIAERLNEKLGTNLVREIYLKAGKPPAPDKAETWVKPKKRELSEAEKERIAAAVAAVSDPQLRRQFAELLEQDLAHTPGKD